MDWLTAIKEVGFPIACACAFAFASWATIKWIANAIIVPVRDRAFKFLDKLEGNVDRMSENLDAQTTSLRDIATVNTSMSSKLTKLVEQGCATHRNGTIGER